jgi:transposase
LRQALEGRVKPHHRLLLTQLLGHIDYLTTAIAEIEREVERCLAPFAEAVTLLQTIPGIGAIAAAIIAEIGVDTGRFPV